MSALWRGGRGPQSVKTTARQRSAGGGARPRACIDRHKSRRRPRRLLLLVHVLPGQNPRSASVGMSGAEEWDARSKVTLIHCYRDEPNIWNQNVVYRSDAERRQSLAEAWQRIQQRMSAMGYNFELPQLKKKMKQLRDQFSRENKMFEDHNSKWQFYEEMSFLNQNDNSSSDYLASGDATIHLHGGNDDIRSFNTTGSLSNGADALFEQKPCPIEEEVASRGTEVKSEIPDSEIDVTLLFGQEQERSGAMVSSSGIVLSETVMDELLRMVLSRKSTLLSDVGDERTKARAWRDVYEFIRGITKITPTIEELKEMFRRKQVYISDIVSRHANSSLENQYLSESTVPRTDIFSVHGFARYIQSIVNKCLPEDKFSVRERELGTYILRKSLSPHESTPPASKRARLAESVERSNDLTVSRYDTYAMSSQEAAPLEAPPKSSCDCRAGEECLKTSLQEMLKVNWLRFPRMNASQRRLSDGVTNASN
ncbi:hypothetical protein Y032_0035g3094 [Ancylostoma ceylanicum]|uniref:MADF domain-containing protein n=1 Tax=Ancylostoma ceylanicum TaxID=53326 RepID=A0A016UMC8_9BILA|nr:hypothetical protein Y032_0035g3094 [Ancylostoma ceylanicum]